jgi:ubiquinone/menaquinone biosynthesis C-methylase UbiE
MGFYSRFILPTIIDKVMDDKQAAEFRARMVPEAEGRVLEIGMGSGHNLPFYGDGVTSVVGLEPSAELMAMARKRAADKSLDIEFVGESAEAMPFENASFDTVLTTWTLCSIGDASAALAEMRRVLKPTGRLIFVEHGLAPTSGVVAWQNFINPIWRPLAGGCNLNRPIDRMISGAGFTIDGLETAYMKGPKPLSYTYLGRARIA